MSEIKKQYVPGKYRSRKLAGSAGSSSIISSAQQVQQSGYTASHGHPNKEVIDLLAFKDLTTLSKLGVDEATGKVYAQTGFTSDYIGSGAWNFHDDGTDLVLSKNGYAVLKFKANGTIEVVPNPEG